MNKAVNILRHLPEYSQTASEVYLHDSDNNEIIKEDVGKSLKKYIKKIFTDLNMGDYEISVKF